MASWKKRTRSATNQNLDKSPREKRRKAEDCFVRRKEEIAVPLSQKVLLLNAVRQPYSTEHYDVPVLRSPFEALIKVEAIGLNPIDWKAPDFNFGIPVLPYIAGREFAGVVVKAPTVPDSRIKKGDVVAIPSTDYRDLRKAAFQEYSIAASFNAIRLPKAVSVHSGGTLGVAFVSAALALGTCMGLNFEHVEDGPDLLNIVRELGADRLPSDIRQECLHGISKRERAKSGDFLVIWGGGSTCAYVVKQLARLAGLKIVSVVDSAKHGLRLSSNEAIRPDLVVDSHNPQRAVDIITATTGGRSRFGFDTIGKETAGHLADALSSSQAAASELLKGEQVFERSGTKLPTPPTTPLAKALRTKKFHLIGLTELPDTNVPNDVALHSVPIKLFHEVREVGEALSAWCERLLVKGLLVPPDVVGNVNGLAGINKGLDQMRRREISGGRLVAVLP